MNVQLRQVEIRQEARFVLWALRCAVAHVRGDSSIAAEIDRGFELADVCETSVEFWTFANALSDIAWSHSVWHDPRCCCASSEELLVLHALAETAERLRGDQVKPAYWWQMILPVASVSLVETAARAWIVALDRAGVMFPPADELIESLQPLQNITQPAGGARLN